MPLNFCYPKELKFEASSTRPCSSTKNNNKDKMKKYAFWTYTFPMKQKMIQNWHLVNECQVSECNPWNQKCALDVFGDTLPTIATLLSAFPIIAALMSALPIIAALMSIIPDYSALQVHYWSNNEQCAPKRNNAKEEDYAKANPSISYEVRLRSLKKNFLKKQVKNWSIWAKRIF
jgi:hypothetical protein